MPAYLRPTVESEKELKFAARTYAGALAFAVLAGGSFLAAYGFKQPIAYYYFAVCGTVCLVLAIWRLFWRDDLTIDLNQRAYIRRRGHWPRITVRTGSLDQIAAVNLILESRPSNFAQLPVWIIGLKFTNPQQPLLVAEFLKNEKKARDYGERLAGQLQRPFVDSTAA